MVPGVGELPVVVGNQGEDPGEEAQKVVGPLPGEEGAVAGVVLQDEQADQEQGGCEVQKEGQGQGNGKGLVGQVKEEEKGKKGVRHLAQAS